MAVRGSCGQPELWSAGSKHHVTALENAAPTVQAHLRGPARQEHATSADGHTPWWQTTPDAPSRRQRHGTRPGTRRGSTPATYGGTPWPAFTPLQRHSRHGRLIWWSQLRAACSPIAGLSRSCRAWSRPSRTTLNTSTRAAESCAWRFTEPAPSPRPGTSAMPVWPATGSAAARRLPFLRRRRRGAVNDLVAEPRGHGKPPTGARDSPAGRQP